LIGLLKTTKNGVLYDIGGSSGGSSSKGTVTDSLMTRGRKRAHDDEGAESGLMVSSIPLLLLVT